eukprot:CAMPEP_0184393912 /NCGR_PEP_ID=MMETSP0007-20130409/37445_2 /TAXON_ID=97485 /ORGANISM="Prymnesium parvum, Strain Texoma1" /LENGTH=148 /DNA_ID=CAMNT_0026745213 /DNA_START=54 /DNA_END=500 /DNA_ORIENTATION=-
MTNVRKAAHLRGARHCTGTSSLGRQVRRIEPWLIPEMQEHDSLPLTAGSAPYKRLRTAGNSSQSTEYGQAFSSHQMSSSSKSSSKSLKKSASVLSTGKLFGSIPTSSASTSMSVAKGGTVPVLGMLTAPACRHEDGSTSMLLAGGGVS